MSSRLKIFSGSSNCSLADNICKILGVKLSKARVSRNEDGECDIEILECVRDSDCFIVQSGFGDLTVNDSLMELYILIMACRMAAARKIIAVLPYFPYSKQSKKKGKRRGIPAKLVADMLRVAGATQVVVLDLHAPQIQAFFDIPVDSLFIEPFIVKYINEKVAFNGCEKLVIVAKNAGGAKRCASVAHKLKAKFALINHIESIESTGNSKLTVIGDVLDRTVIILDDMMNGVDMFTEAAKVVKNKGATFVYCVVTHGIFSGNSIEKLNNSDIDVIITTNTINQEGNLAKTNKLNIIDISPLITEAIRRINYGESLSFLVHSVPF
ncbi:ribose-phosphate pyrophosphokinase 1-like [Zophobas morio]|jgi:ribose-phosphate pyrophosphokinase|uniref:ribose-phosphate pyrophosphokinase 1-like n=1 Tax=Zophobas morio TaxID=2755281 RepID=UPI003083DBEA